MIANILWIVKFDYDDDDDDDDDRKYLVDCEVLDDLEHLVDYLTCSRQ